MMNNMAKQASRVRKAFCCSLVGAVFTLSGSVQANTVNLTVNYTILQGTCDISVPATVTLTGGRTSDVADQNWVYLGSQTVPVTLSNCSGRGEVNTRPALKLTSPPMATSGSTERQSRIFMTTATNTTGMGVVLAPSAFTNGSYSNLVTVSAGTGYLDIGAVDTAASNGTINIYAAIACGSTSDCAASNLYAGSDSVALTFTFAYH